MGEVKKKNGGGKYEKRSFSQPFLAHSGGGQETHFYLRVALVRSRLRVTRNSHYNGVGVNSRTIL